MNRYFITSFALCFVFYNCGFEDIPDEEAGSLSSSQEVASSAEDAFAEPLDGGTIDAFGSATGDSGENELTEDLAGELDVYEVDTSPAIELPSECADGLDNDQDGTSDCEDSDCAALSACETDGPPNQAERQEACEGLREGERCPIETAQGARQGVCLVEGELLLCSRPTN